MTNLALKFLSFSSKGHFQKPTVNHDTQYDNGSFLYIAPFYFGLTFWTSSCWSHRGGPFGQRVRVPFAGAQVDIVRHAAQGLAAARGVG